MNPQEARDYLLCEMATPEGEAVRIGDQTFEMRAVPLGTFRKVLGVDKASADASDVDRAAAVELVLYGLHTESGPAGKRVFADDDYERLLELPTSSWIQDAMKAARRVNGIALPGDKKGDGKADEDGDGDQGNSTATESTSGE